MDKDKKKVWDRLKHIPKTKEEMEKEIQEIRQMWYTMRRRISAERKRRG